MWGRWENETVCHDLSARAHTVTFLSAAEEVVTAETEPRLTGGHALGFLVETGPVGVLVF